MATLNNTWKFNDSVVFPSDTSIFTQTITFSVEPGISVNENNSVTYSLGLVSFTGFEYSADLNGGTLTYVGADATDSRNAYSVTHTWNNMYKTYQEAGVGGLMENYLLGWGQTIVFNSEQEVTQEFYDWFTANATPIVRTLSGEWRFTSEPAMGDIEQSINFTSGGTSFDKMAFSGDNSAYYYVGDETTLVYEAFQWGDSAYKTVNFGDAPQEVSGIFYSWFTNNAFQYEWISAGTYTFDKVLDLSTLSMQGIWFTAGNATTRYTIMIMNDTSDTLAYYAGGTPGTTTVVYSNGVWVSEDYRTITLDSDQEVSKSFYAWFMKNTDGQVPIKAGAYRWNDDIPYTETSQYQVSLPIIIETTISVDNQTGTATLVNEPSSFTTIGAIYATGLNPSQFVIAYYPNEMPAYSSVNKWDMVYHYLVDFGFTVDESIKGYGQIITITEDTYVSEEFYTWFMDNARPLTIKAGTYRFNDDPNITSEFDFPLPFKATIVAGDNTYYGDFERLSSVITDNSSYLLAGYCVSSEPPIDVLTLPSLLGFYVDGNWGVQVITVTADTEVSAEFYSWFTANAADITDAVSTIKYDGKIIAALKAQEIATIECAGQIMSDNITVDMENCTGHHIMEVDELPTEQIDDNVLYKLGDKYYQWGDYSTLKDVILVINGAVNSMLEASVIENIVVEFYYEKTKPTDNIRELTGDTFSIYYIEDEDNMFVYAEATWHPLSDMWEVPNHGTITDSSQAVADGYYALVTVGGWKVYGNPYIIEVDTLPTEDIVKDAVYRVLEEKCVDIGIYSDNGEYVSIILLLQALLGVPINIFNVDSLDSVENPLPSPTTWYYCRADHKLYGYNADDNVWVAADGQDEDSIGTPGWKVKNDYAYYLNSSLGFHDIALVANGMRYLFSEISTEVTSSYHTIHTKATENTLTSTFSEDATICHFYYIEDENDIFIYGDPHNTGVNDWYSIEGMYSTEEEQISFGGCVSDISEITDVTNGYYAVISDWEKHIRPRGTLAIFENGKTFDVREFASVTTVIPKYDGGVVYK